MKTSGAPGKNGEEGSAEQPGVSAAAGKSGEQDDEIL
jgi:hypothetical protein